ncbi:MAG: hypothetical protein NVSMB62_26390 [Acidobacteriaceae bacterium]
MIAVDDLFTGVLVGVGRKELHDEACKGASSHQAGNDGPMVRQVVLQNGRPESVQDRDGHSSYQQPDGDADERSDEEPLVQVARVGGSEVLPDGMGKIAAEGVCRH